MPTRIKIVALTLLLSPAAPQVTPVEGIRENPPRVWALTHGTVHTAPGKILNDATIVLRQGRIEAVGVDLKVPTDATSIDLQGMTVYPGFIDAWVEVAEPDSGQPNPRTNRDHWNTRMAAYRIPYDYYRPKEKELKELRRLGFTAAHLVPEKGIFRGQSSLVQLGDSPLVLRSAVGQVVAFQYGGWGETEYPNSLLGSIAFIRQALLDAAWYRKARPIYLKDPAGVEAVAEDRSLEALGRARQTRQPFIFAPRDAGASLRAQSIGDEFDLVLWLKGNGYEYRQLSALQEGNPFIILPLNHPPKPDVSNPHQALQYTTAQLKHWDQAPDNPRRLLESDLEIGLTSSDLKKRGDFRSRLARSVRRGLSEEAALAALTTVPAERLGLGLKLGKIAPGYLGNLVVVEGNYFDGQATVRAVWIGGDQHPLEPLPRIDFSGEWQLKVPSGEWVLELSQTKTRWKGSLKRDTLAYPLKNLTVEDDRITWTLELDTLGFEGVTRFVGQGRRERVSGQAFAPRGTTYSWNATRLEAEEDESDETPPAETASELEVVYPEGAFGLAEPPDKPYAILVNDATIWTCGPQGVLNGWDILFINGKVKNIAPDISVPRRSALVIDGRGKHLTPGLIDCHSHLAAASINEGAQAITAEVRMRDVIDPDDIAIYRSLAGGLTTINLLHGSANPIGGQNAVLKLRWGSPARDLLYQAAPPGIKFALGENVKRSNWIDPTNRYPKTRMGVEQIIRDAFSAARDYQHHWTGYQRGEENRPPRRDLELEALVETLEGERLLHCHSYRQDEILMLTRVAEDFGFTVATFQHVLEGYKVAERLAEHGAGASTFSDWWAYKYEVIDAIPFNGTLMSRAGVTVSFNSDSDELARRLNTEAAKAVKYGGLSEEEALKLVTINPARQLQIDRWVGSLEVGKEADFVIWSGQPLSSYSRVEQTWIEGRQYFSLEKDRELHQRDTALRNTLIQKILKAPEEEDTMPPAAPRRGYSCWEEEDSYWQGGQ